MPVAFAVGLTLNVCAIGPVTGDAALPCALAPVTFDVVTVQKYLVLVTLFGLVKPMLVVAPLQIDCCAGLTANVGTGFTVTVRVIGVPAQPFALGVIVYVTVPWVLPVVLVSVWDMVLPLPAVAPVTLLALTVQL